MLTMTAEGSELLVIDMQARLLPAIDRGERVIANAARLIAAARRLDLPVCFTEQYPAGLGHTVEALEHEPGEVVEKMSFDAGREQDLAAALSGERDVVVCGCEAHVCVLQTVLGLLERRRRVFVVADAIGSRREESRDLALKRMARHGAEIVTTEMALFEWLGSARNPAFRELSALIK